MYLINDSFFKDYPRPISTLLTCLWFFGFYLSVSGVAVQFLFRYSVLCRKVPFSNKILLIIIFILLCCYSFNSWLFTTSYIASEDDIDGYYRGILQNYSYFTENEVAFNVGTMVSTIVVLYDFTFYFFYFIAFYCFRMKLVL